MVLGEGGGGEMEIRIEKLETMINGSIPGSQSSNNSQSVQLVAMQKEIEKLKTKVDEKRWEGRNR